MSDAKTCPVCGDTYYSDTYYAIHAEDCLQDLIRERDEAREALQGAGRDILDLIRERDAAREALQGAWESRDQWRARARKAEANAQWAQRRATEMERERDEAQQA